MEKQEPKEVGNNRDSGRENKKRNRDRPRRTYTADSFRGEHKDLQNWVFVYDGAARAYQYSKTKEAITKWVLANLPHPTDIEKVLENLADPDTSTWKPKKEKDLDAYDTAMLGKMMEKYLNRMEKFSDNKCKVFSIVLGQCNEPLLAKLRGQNDWETIYSDKDLAGLMKGIKKWMMNQETSRSPIASAVGATKTLHRMRQNYHETLSEYRKRFDGACEVVDHMGIDIDKLYHDLVTKSLEAEEKVTRATADQTQIKKAEQRVKKKILAYMFIDSVDRTRYANVATYLENEYLANSDRFPADVTAAYNMLENWKQQSNQNTTPHNDGCAFPQGAWAGPSRPPLDKSNMQCRGCGVLGHFEKDGKCDPEKKAAWQEQKKKGPTHTMNCMVTTAPEPEEKPQEEEPGDGVYRVVPSMCMTHKSSNDNTGKIVGEDGSVQTVMTHSFNTARASVIPPGSVGLDSMSSVDVFADAELLVNIRAVKSRMTIICNAGEVVVHQQGDVPGYGTVWYHPEAIANILSLYNVQRKFKIQYNSEDGDFFTLERPNGTIRVFEPTNMGLYVSQFMKEDADVAMVTTVAENLESYTKREVKKARQARRLMTIVGRPSEQQFINIIRKKQLLNCRVTEQDVKSANAIFGPEVGALKGKTTRKAQPHVQLETRPIPPEVRERHQEVTAGFDVMFVNGIPFAVSISRGLKFATAEALGNRKTTTLFNSVENIKDTYAKRGFLLNKLMADNEFTSLERPLSTIGVSLNVVSRDEHVPEVERFIRTLKERCRAVVNALPYKRMPNRMIAELVYAQVFWLNAFPAQDGVSSHMSPRELVTGLMLDTERHCRVPYGTYVQTHEQHDNSMAPRTIGAIALRPTGNDQGGHYFLNLTTGRLINRNAWTELPMPAEIVTRVEALAENRNANALVFGDRHNHEVEVERDGDPLDDGPVTDSETTSNESDSDPDDDNDDDDSDGHSADEEDPPPAEEEERLYQPKAKPERRIVTVKHEHMTQAPFDELPETEHDPTPTIDDHGNTAVDDETEDAEAHSNPAPPGAETMNDDKDDDTHWPSHEAPHVEPLGDDTEPMQDTPQLTQHRPTAQKPTRTSARTRRPSARAAAAIAQHFDEDEDEAGPVTPSETDPDWHPDMHTDDTMEGPQRTGVPRHKASARPTARIITAGVRAPRRKKVQTQGGTAVEDGLVETAEKATSDNNITTTREMDGRAGLQPRKKSKINVSACNAMTTGTAQRAHLLTQADLTVTPPDFDVHHLAEASFSLEPVFSAILTQYSITRGLKKFGQQGDDAVCNEMRQLHELGVLVPTSPSTLTDKERHAALNYLMFLKKKRDGSIKGRGCADGRKQRASIFKDEVSSPTIKTESVFLLLTIAAKERRHVIIMDIPGAFLQTELKGEVVHVRIEARMAELLTSIDPALYEPYVTIERGRPVLYAQLQKALYGMLQSAMRFWEQVLDDLATLGFTINPYDWCVANRMVNGHQQTVGWHVDDFLISHVDPAVNEGMHNWFNEKYGQRTPVTVQDGKEFDYLGMQVNMQKEGAVRIIMTAYIDELLDESPADFSGTEPTPAAKHLFETSDNTARLDDARAATFHHLTAKSLFLAKRARPDIQLAVSFLCTRVSCSDEHDWKKLGRVVQYLRGTKGLPLTLEAESMHVIKWWVDAAFAVTKDMRSQSGAYMTLGKGASYSSSLRQRLNTRSSTEAELVGVDDFMPQILWTRRFLEAQGYDISDNLLKQDNKSAILLETNGKASSGKRTRHLDIRYFFVADRVKKGDLRVEHCPADSMVGDFFTKPLQGTPFKRFRDLVLNIQA